MASHPPFDQSESAFLIYDPGRGAASRRRTVNITPQSASCRLDRAEQPVCLIVDAGGEEELIAVPCEPTIPEGESP